MSTRKVADQHEEGKLHAEEETLDAAEQHDEPQDEQQEQHEQHDRDVSGESLRLPQKAAPAPRVADQLYRRLRRAIIDGSIPARSRLVEVDLAQALNASRTPVREAISRLTSDYLVKPLAYGGVEVIDTQGELDEIYFIREALEGCAARLAAERVTQAELTELEALLAETKALPQSDFQRRVQINRRFHDLITHASRSDRVIQMVEGFREFFLSEKVLSRYSKRESENAISDHQEIVDAMKERDGKKCERLIRRHLEQDRKRVLKERIASLKRGVTKTQTG
jgi:DNA-binding GntR family transcriptional regulator